MERFEVQEREIIDINRPPRNEWRVYVNIPNADDLSYDSTRIQEDTFKAEYMTYVKWISSGRGGNYEFGRYIEYRLWFMIPCDNEYTEQRSRDIMEQRVRSMQYDYMNERWLRECSDKHIPQEPKLLDDELFEVD